jgi:hypothetical protein
MSSPINYPAYGKYIGLLGVTKKFQKARENMRPDGDFQVTTWRPSFLLISIEYLKEGHSYFIK